MHFHRSRCGRLGLRGLALVAALALPAAAAPAIASAEVTRCNGQLITKRGTEGPDVIVGTSGRDVIAALGGDDRVSAGPGDDVVCLGAGNDALNGGAGNDLLVAEPVLDGIDSFSGGLGTLDTVSYAQRTVPLSVSLDNVDDDGQLGERDNIHLDVENVTGGFASDRLTGNAVLNGLRGQAGNDRLDGGPGPDSIDGGDGNDALRGGLGNDVLDGDDGRDVAVAEAVPDGADFFQGGLDRDTASYAARSERVLVTLDLSANDGAAGERDHVGGNVLDVEQVTGGAASDILTLQFVITDRVTLFGNGGNDVISTSATGIGDTADGGAGFDHCFTDATDLRRSCP
jgi:hypothetical protein